MRACAGVCRRGGGGWGEVSVASAIACVVCVVVRERIEARGRRMDDDGEEAWRWRGMVAESILQPQSPLIVSRLVAGNGTRFGCSLWCMGAKGALAKGNQY